MNIGEVLQRLTSALDHADIRYMLTGSFASAYYGALRSTVDIDIVIEANAPQLCLLMQNLSSKNYYAPLEAALAAHEANSMFNTIDQATGWKTDFIMRKNRPFSREEFGRRTQVELEGRVFIATPEDIILSKLEWSKLGHSQRQMEDAARVLRAQKGKLDLAYVEKWVEDLGVDQQWRECQSAAEST